MTQHAEDGPRQVNKRQTEYICLKVSVKTEILLQGVRKRMGDYLPNWGPSGKWWRIDFFHGVDLIDGPWGEPCSSSFPFLCIFGYKLA